jgi:hypothetical protein
MCFVEPSSLCLFFFPLPPLRLIHSADYSHRARPESITNPPHTARTTVDGVDGSCVEGRTGGGGGKSCRGSQCEARGVSMRRVCGSKSV